MHQNQTVYLTWDRGEGEYATAQGKDTPADGVLNDATDVFVEFDADLDYAHAKPANDPICQGGENNDTIEGDVLFPYWPIERVVQVFGGLWNKYDIRICFIFKTVRF